MNPGPLVVVLVGAGPGGTVLLERLIANAPALAGRPVHVHVADPHPPGGGRVWRLDQPELLWMNSRAADVTMFTDETVAMAGPIRPGPTLCEWGDVEPGLFPSRRLQNAYLSWCFEHVTGSAPESVTVRVHATRVLDVTDHDGTQLVRLEGREEPIAADAVVFAQGHLDVEPAAEHRALADHAAAHGLTYVPPHYAADTDLAVVRAGEPVVMRGMGLGFVDDMVLLTEARGGRYTPRADGGLTYHPSGREPILYAGSRRGVPYHSKITYELRGERPPGPRHFTPALTRELYERQGPLDLRRDLWPLIAKELAWYYYHELFAAHPERVAVPWAEFEARLDAGVADVEEAIPKSEDRLDLDRLLDPLAGVRFEDAAELQDWMRGYVTADVERHADPAHSADLALFFGLLTVFGVLVDAVDNGRLTARSQAEELGAWLHGVFGYYASGPPPRRLRELEALSRAGVVRFLGRGVTVAAEDGVFRAGGTAVPGTVETRALIESRLPVASLARTTDPLLRALHDRGEVAEELLTGPDGTRYPLGKLALREGRLVRADGETHPRRFALGAWAGRGFAIAGFTRPRTNALSFRLADALARAVLDACRE